MKALLIVDIQNDFCPGGSLAVKEGDKIVSRINKIKESRLFPIVVLTRDWHPKNHVSFASAHPGYAVSDIVDVDGIPQILWPDHCVQGTMGAAFHKDLIIHRSDIIVSKGTDPKIDSYSAFYDNARKKETGLATLLREKHCDEIFICGLATDYCVKFSALDAVKEGFNTSVILDVCRGVDLKTGDVDRAVEEMKNGGAKIISSSVFF